MVMVLLGNIASNFICYIIIVKIIFFYDKVIFWKYILKYVEFNIYYFKHVIH